MQAICVGNLSVLSHAIWRVFLGLALCAVLGLLPVRAQTSAAAAGTDWAHTATKLQLTPRVQYLKEAPGTSLQWQQALASNAWKPSDAPGMVALQGPTTLWMQVDIENTGATALTRWVVVGYWVLRDVQLFELDTPNNRLLAHQRSGQNLAPADRALDSEEPAFAVTLQPGQSKRLLLRVSDSFWRRMAVDAWDAPSYRKSTAKAELPFAAMLGAVLALLVVLLLQRDKIFVLVAAWMGLSFLLELTVAGLFSAYAIPVRVIAPSMVALCVGLLSTGASAFIILYFMGLNTHRFWRLWNWCLFAVAMGVGTAALVGYSNTMRKTIAFTVGIQLLSNLCMLAWVRVRGNPLRQWLLVFMLANILIGISRIVAERYFIDADVYDTLLSVSFAVKGSVVLAVIALVALQRRRDQDQVRAQLREAEQGQRDVLQAAVDQRTADLREALLVANDASRAKNDFLARVSHDLRSPLTSINGYAQLLQRLGGSTGSMAETIARSADHMLKMVNDLIAYARGAGADTPQPQPVYIHSLLDDVAREAVALAERNHNRFALTLESELPSVLVVDAKRLRQMLVNLLDNACKFTRNGQVELRVSALPAATLEGEADRYLLRLVVSDSGPGIAGADQAQVFEPFYRAASAEGTQGAGLGLSIVATWAQRMGGAVALQSAPGQGATFALSLPVWLGEEAQLSEPRQPSDAAYLPPLEGANRCIWVVEDSEEIRELLAMELRSVGFQVVLATDGAHFVELIHTPQVTLPQLIVTDYLMPRANGAAVLQAARTYLAGVPVVLLSATQKTMHTMGVAVDEGFDASLMKPVNLATLRTTVSRLLRIQTPDPVPTPEPLRMRLPADDMARVRQWLEMGAWTDLMEWAEGLPSSHPEYADTAQHLRTLLAQARFHEVLALFESESEGTV